MQRKIMPPVADAPRILHVCAYARVSTGKEAMLHSLAAQVSYYSSLIQGTPGWRYGGVYADEARIGTKDDRPQFQRMISDCRAGKVDLILTKSISRFARNTLTLLETVRELKALGIGVTFEEECIDTLSKEGELLLTILAAYAQDESRAVSEHTRWRIQKKFEAGIATHNGILGYRLVDGIYQVEPCEAAIVQLIFDSYLRGLGCNAIARLLRDIGVVSRYGKPFCRSTVHGILRNEKYTGLLILQKYYTTDHITKQTVRNRGEQATYTVEDAHEPIIHAALFQQAQAEMQRRQEYYQPEGTPPKSIYPFSSLIRCANCGTNYRRKIAGSGPYRRPVWICETFNQQGKRYCASQQIPESILMEKTTEVLGIKEINIQVIQEKVKQILAHSQGRLTFLLHSGELFDVQWEHRSRRDIWTNEMRAAARDKANRRQCTL